MLSDKYTSTWKPRSILIHQKDPLIGNFIKSEFSKLNLSAFEISPSVSFRHSWTKFKTSPFILIHWENPTRSAGAIVEEIIDTDPTFDVTERIIIITTSPTRQDVIYFSELGLTKVLKLNSHSATFHAEGLKLQKLIDSCSDESETPTWHTIKRQILALDTPIESETVRYFENQIESRRTKENTTSEYYYEACALLNMKQEKFDGAEELFNRAIKSNPANVSPFTGLAENFSNSNRLDRSKSIYQKLQEYNNKNQGRLTALGDLHLKQGETDSAEPYYKAALDNDGDFSGALAGLAMVKFQQNKLEQSRNYLKNPQLRKTVASELNQKGINLVLQGAYSKALEFYRKAQYVVSDQQKDPMLLYNMGLCYSRWNKPDQAKLFLQLAIIKKPDYSQAKNLLQSLATSTSS
jgi:tetratricopeptide (TPR) repeat protein